GDPEPADAGERGRADQPQQEHRRRGAAGDQRDAGVAEELRGEEEPGREPEDAGDGGDPAGPAPAGGRPAGPVEEQERDRPGESRGPAAARWAEELSARGACPGGVSIW